MLLLFAYLAATNAFAALRLLSMSDRAKDADILALRHQITVLGRPAATRSDSHLKTGPFSQLSHTQPETAKTLHNPGHKQP
ncbi:hypothetical protein ACWDKQ_33675 [Saccharopolyspora sp. NPDC000995]